MFVILLSASGLALNHIDTLGLHEIHVQAPFLLDLYGVAPPADPVSFPVDSHTVTGFGGRIFWDDTVITRASAPLAGALRQGRLVVVALDDRLLLLTPQGETVERLGDAAGVPPGIERIGLDAGGRVVVAGSRGLERVDLSTLRWEDAPSAAVDWARSRSLPESRQDELMAEYRSAALSLEKVILDVHSGRILGAWGPWLVDAAAVLFLVLAVTGLWLWTRARR